MIKYWSRSILRVDSVYKINLNNSQQCIKIDKITINMSLKSIIEDPKTIVYPFVGANLISNQTPVTSKAKKSVAFFKLRKGMLTGVKVNLRGDTALNFLNLFIFVVLPTHKNLDFYGLDNKGSLAINIKNPFAFPQLSLFYDRFSKNMTGVININLNINNKQHSKLFYTGLSFPFMFRRTFGI